MQRFRVSPPPATRCEPSLPGLAVDPYDESMPNWSRPRHADGERHPLRRLSSIGGTTSGWRSTLETSPHGSFWNFLIGTLVAGGIIALLMALAAILGNR